MLKLTMKQLKARLPLYIKADQPLMIWGGPGEGKSGMVNAAVKSIGGYLQDYRLLLRDTVDVHGIPKEMDGRMHWCPPVEIPLATDNIQKNHVVFLDEISAAPTGVQTVAYQMLHERAVDSKPLHSNVRFIAAGNREGDSAVSNTMPSPLKNRLAHVDVTCDSESWIEWGSNSGVFAPILAFIEKSPNSLRVENTKEYMTEYAFRSPRTWEYASDGCKVIMDGGDEYTKTIISELTDYVASLVGGPTAANFAGYMVVGSKLPKPADICSGKISGKKFELHEQFFIQQSVLAYLSEAREMINNKEYYKDVKFSNMVDSTLKFVNESFDAETLAAFINRFIDPKWYGFSFNAESTVQSDWAKRMFNGKDEKSKLIFAK